MRLDHITILTNDVAESVAFFREILGLEAGPRPPFSFDGAWLYAEGIAVVHLKAPNWLGPENAGAIEHAAFATDDFDGVVARLSASGRAHRVQRLPDGSRRQCFFQDPNGAQIEVTGD